MLDAKAEVDPRDNGQVTPLIAAAQDGAWEGLKVLVVHRADLSHVDKLGRSALLLAAEHRNMEVVKLLFNQGAGGEVFTTLMSMTGLAPGHLRKILDDSGVGPRTELDLEGFKDLWIRLGLPRDFSHHFFRALDQNNDSKIQFCELFGLEILSTNDVESAAEFFFRMFDADSSGAVDFAEFQDVIRGTLRMMAAGIRSTLVTWLAENNDELEEDLASAVERNEGVMVNEIFNAIDLDRDQKITREEFKEAARHPQLQAVLFPHHKSHRECADRVIALKPDLEEFDLHLEREASSVDWGFIADPDTGKVTDVDAKELRSHLLRDTKELIEGDIIKKVDGEKFRALQSQEVLQKALEMRLSVKRDKRKMIGKRDPLAKRSSVTSMSSGGCPTM